MDGQRAFLESRCCSYDSFVRAVSLPRDHELKCLASDSAQDCQMQALEDHAVSSKRTFLGGMRTALSGKVVAAFYERATRAPILPSASYGLNV